MIDIKLHTPVGVNDILPDEKRKKDEIYRRIEGVFKSYGYNAVESPMFEYLEVFSDEKMGSTNPNDMFRFFDRNGGELALRSDMTPPIARIAATAFSGTSGPLRFSYSGNAFRYNKDYQGKLCEFSQAGIELMGPKSIEADAEVVALAVKSILASGICEFRIHIGEVSFFNSILNETRLSVENKNKLKELIANRNYVGMEELLEENEMPGETKKLFLELHKMVGNDNVLKQSKELVKSDEAKTAIKNLMNLYECLKIHGVDEYIVFDLGMVNHLNYYTGIIFRGYTYGTGYSILDGGRYDDLVSQFGKNIPAVGFGIKITEVLNVLENSNVNLNVCGTKALFAYGDNGMAAALRMADEYRKSGISVENSLVGANFDENIKYAKERKMENVLYFVDDENIKFAKIDDEIGVFVSDITVKELIKPGRGN
ncbi:MAG: ATP phosphoribosyltransferase regulatory subunit [Firmicutes bacterium]|nr:ATP phosphoribosyltransferase regulatory subunit [Bacillota bacterium]